VFCIYAVLLSEIMISRFGQLLRFSVTLASVGLAAVCLCALAKVLRGPANAQLLEALVSQCTYPADFAGDWDDVAGAGVDEAVFCELRGEQPVSARGGGGSGGVSADVTDALSTCFHVLKHGRDNAPLKTRGMCLHLMNQWNACATAHTRLLPAPGATPGH